MHPDRQQQDTNGGVTFDVIAAASDTMKIAVANQMPFGGDSEKTDMGHLIWMHGVMSPDWPEGKLNRWLGWMQACVVMSCESVTLEDMKAINAMHTSE